MRPADLFLTVLTLGWLASSVFVGVAVRLRYARQARRARRSLHAKAAEDWSASAHEARPLSPGGGDETR